ncbi:MAG: NAD-dependent epimerase/dehydratase family protein, partial [Myxococcota bacterium]|nr:NAD-dependent epimerase/dehydratase family protein [Myxococcota bacterium]
FQEGSITDLDTCHAAAEGVDGIFHEAAQVSVPASVADPMGSYEVNVLGTHNLLEAARAAGVERFVFAASSAAYGESKELPKHEGMSPQPCSPYASGKVAAEHLLAVYARCFNLQTVSLRYFNVFGPRQADDSPYTGVIAIFARALLEGRAPTIHGDGEQTRDFIHAKDVARANLLAADAPGASGGRFNVASGRGTRVSEVVSLVSEVVGRELSVVNEAARPGDIRHSHADIEAARKVLGFEPRIDLERGLCRTIEEVPQ